MKGYSGALDFDFVIFLTANLNGRYDTLDIFRPGSSFEFTNNPVIFVAVTGPTAKERGRGWIYPPSY